MAQHPSRNPSEKEKMRIHQEIRNENWNSGKEFWGAKNLAVLFPGFMLLLDFLMNLCIFLFPSGLLLRFPVQGFDGGGGPEGPAQEADSG
jgi:hypothetical protein